MSMLATRAGTCSCATAPVTVTRPATPRALRAGLDVAPGRAVADDEQARADRHPGRGEGLDEVLDAVPGAHEAHEADDHRVAAAEDGRRVAREVGAVAHDRHVRPRRAGLDDQVGQHARHAEHAVGLLEQPALGVRGPAPEDERLVLGALARERRVDLEQQRHAQAPRGAQARGVAERVALVDEVGAEAAARGRQARRGERAIGVLAQLVERARRPRQPAVPRRRPRCPSRRPRPGSGPTPRPCGRAPAARR
jgi:hypothetical protein